MKGSDGKYTINGKKYDLLEGSKAQVWHGTAFKTPGGVLHSGLKKNKHGHIVSVKKSNIAKKEKRLEKAGYYTKKGVFGSFKKNKTIKKSRKKKSRKKKSRR